MKFWLKVEDIEYLVGAKLRNKPQFPTLTPWNDYVQGELSPNEFHARYKGQVDVPFNIGQINLFDRIRDPNNLYVSFEPYSLLTKYTIMVARSWIDVALSRGRRTINQHRDVERIEILGSGGSFVDKVFRTYEDVHRTRKKTGYIPRLLLYDPNNNMDSNGNLARLHKNTYAELEEVTRRCETVQAPL